MLFKIKPLFVIITISFLFGFSCKKKPQEFNISSELKALWDFKHGTYWVYQDSISEEMDTVNVYNYVKSYSHSVSWNNFTGEDAKFEHILYQYNLFNDSIRLGIGFSDYNNNPPQDYMGASIIPNEEILKFDLSLINDYNSSFKYIIKLEDILPNSQLYKYEVKPNIGVTRYEFRDGRVYKLIRQQIVQ